VDITLGEYISQILLIRKFVLLILAREILKSHQQGGGVRAGAPE